MKLNQKDGNINVKNLHGSFSISTKGKGEINLDRVDANQLYLNILNK